MSFINDSSIRTYVASNKIDRRTLLGGLACSGLAAVSPLSRAVQGGAIEASDCIDSHVHVWTPDLAKYPLSPNFSESDMVPKSFTPDQLLTHTRNNGVKRVVLIQMNFSEFDNSYMTDCIQAHPGVFAGVGILDHSKAGVVQEMRRLGELGVRGFRLYADATAVDGWTSDAGINRMWKEGAESGQAMCLLSNPDSLAGIARMCAKYPKTRVVVDHFSRIGMRGPVTQEQLRALGSLAEFENVYVKTSAFYALGKKVAPYADLVSLIEQVVRTFGASRLMWGSDCPYQVEDGHTYESSIALIQELVPSLTAEDKSWLLKKTAEKLFF